MGVGSLSKLALKELFKRKIVIVLMLIVNIVSFYLCDRMIAIVREPYYYEEMVKREMPYPLEDLYRIDVMYQGHSLQGMLSVRDLLKYTEGLEAVQGSGAFGLLGGYEELDNKEDFRELVIRNKGAAGALSMDWSLMGLKDQKLYEGTIGKVEDNMKFYPALVGYELKDMAPIGTVLTSYEKTKYEVVGILEKGSAWLPEVLGQGPPLNLDTRIVAPFDPALSLNADSDDPDWLVYYNSNEGLYFYGDSIDKTTLELVKQHAKALGLGVKVQSVKDIFKEERQSVGNIDLFRIILFVVLVLFSILSISSAAIVSTLLRKRCYGVMLANGISTRDIGTIVVLRNAFIIITSLLIAFGYRQNELLNSFFNRQMNINMHMWFVSKYLIGVGLIILVISCVLPILIIRRMKTVELIRGDE